MFPFYSINIPVCHLTFTVLDMSLRPIATMPVASSDPYYTHKQPIRILFLTFYIYRLLVFFFFLQGGNRNTAGPYQEQNYIHTLPGIRTGEFRIAAVCTTYHATGRFSIHWLTIKMNIFLNSKLKNIDLVYSTLIFVLLKDKYEVFLKIFGNYISALQSF